MVYSLPPLIASYDFEDNDTIWWEGGLGVNVVLSPKISTGIVSTDLEKIW
jgi:hypothetical protein